MMATLGGCGDGYELPCHRIKESGDPPDHTSPTWLRRADQRSVTRHPNHIRRVTPEPVIGPRLARTRWANTPYALRRQHGPSDSLRKRDRTEECLRIEVILAGFIDDPKHIVPLGCRVAQRYVDFAFLKRDRITIVVHADDQLFCLCLCHVSKQMFDLVFLAADSGSSGRIEGHGLASRRYCT